MPDQPATPGLGLEPASPDDIPLILELIRELAAYEHEPDAAQATAEQLHEALFGARPAAEAVIARIDGHAAGWALWFQNFSTWTGKPGLWLEDLFVRPDFRGRGAGKAMLVYLAQLCLERGYGRFEWSVLDWNTPSIEFYKALGAEPMAEWTNYRVTGDALRRLAGR